MPLQVLHRFLVTRIDVEDEHVRTLEDIHVLTYVRELSDMDVDLGAVDVGGDRVQGRAGLFRAQV